MFCIIWDIKLLSLGKTDSGLCVSVTTMVNRLLERPIVQDFFFLKPARGQLNLH